MRKLIKKYEQRFWIAFILVAIFSGWFSIETLEGYTFIKSIHEPLQATAIEHGPEGLLSADDVTKWRDKQTGKVFSFEDDVYKKHRSNQADKVSIIAFGYGLIGCIAFAIFRMKLSGWHRIGIVLSVLWMPAGFWFYAFIFRPRNPEIIELIIFLISSILIGWFFVYLVLWTFRWIKRGFQESTSSSHK